MTHENHCSSRRDNQQDTRLSIALVTPAASADCNIWKAMFSQRRDVFAGREVSNITNP